jgi:hypothetical protein
MRRVPDRPHRHYRFVIANQVLPPIARAAREWRARCLPPSNRPVKGCRPFCGHSPITTLLTVLPRHPPPPSPARRLKNYTTKVLNSILLPEFYANIPEKRRW